MKGISGGGDVVKIIVTSTMNFLFPITAEW